MTLGSSSARQTTLQHDLTEKRIKLKCLFRITKKINFIKPEIEGNKVKYFGMQCWCEIMFKYLYRLSTFKSYKSSETTKNVSI